MPYDYYLKFDNLQPEVYFILRTEKHDVPQLYIKYVMSLFGIKKIRYVSWIFKDNQGKRF